MAEKKELKVLNFDVLYRFLFVMILVFSYFFIDVVIDIATTNKLSTTQRRQEATRVVDLSYKKGVVHPDYPDMEGYSAGTDMETKVPSTFSIDYSDSDKISDAVKDSDVKVVIVYRSNAKVVKEEAKNNPLYDNLVYKKESKYIAQPITRIVAYEGKLTQMHAQINVPTGEENYIQATIYFPNEVKVKGSDIAVKMTLLPEGSTIESTSVVRKSQTRAFYKDTLFFIVCGVSVISSIGAYIAGQGSNKRAEAIWTWIMFGAFILPVAIVVGMFIYGLIIGVVAFIKTCIAVAAGAFLLVIAFLCSIS
ncbi:MAG: hypothetical protein RR594_06380 [Clostridia bacterium]